MGQTFLDNTGGFPESQMTLDQKIVLTFIEVLEIKSGSMTMDASA
jgi:hypothetical protein